jgi:hypothetical protein
MPKFNESQMKAVLSATKDARRASANLGIIENSRIKMAQHPLENFAAASQPATAGFDVEKFAKLREQHQTELRLMLEQRKSEALKHSYDAKDTLRYGIESRLKNVELLPAAANYELLTRPFLIWWSQGIDFPEVHYEEVNSWAKFSIHSEDSLNINENMTFYFLWNNPSDAFAVVNVDGYLVVDGFCVGKSEGGFLPGFRYSLIDMNAELHLLEWWNQPPTEPLSQFGQNQNVVNLSTNTGGFMDSDAVAFQHVFRGYDLRHELFVIPPRETVVIEVALMLTYGSNHGSVDIDLSSGNFQVMCPAVLIAVVS